VGKGVAALTLVCDALKGVLSVVIAILISKIFKDVDVEILKYLAGLFAIIGHTYPVFFEFRGGKGVATALGVLLTLNWKIGLICLIFALAIMVITRIVSIGSILAAILYPILMIFIGDASLWCMVIAFLIALLVIFNHRENLKRLRNGEESKLNFKK